MAGEHWDVWLAIYPPPHASADALRALGAAVAAFAAAEPRVAVGGLDELLAGRYPPPHDTAPVVADPDGPFEGFPGAGRYSVPDPWRHCGALVRARRSEASDEELIRALRRAVPAALGTVAQAYSFG